MPEGVRSPHPIVVEWEGEKRFRGGLPDGPSLIVDGDRQVSPSPVDTLVATLGSCSAIDVVEFLRKRRTPASRLTVHLDFSRAPSPPRRLTRVNAHFIVATASERHHVERAIELAYGKYCSVASSLAPDTYLTWSLELLPPEIPEVER